MNASDESEYSAPAPLSRRMTLLDLRAAREDGRKLAMLTCYDFTSAKLLADAGVPLLLVGDSAANVILGHETTRPVSLGFMTEIAAAVRRGSPLAFLTVDAPFGAVGDSVARSVRRVVRLLQLSGADCVKIEVTAAHVPLVRRLTEIGVPVMAHLGLRPQSVGLTGAYKAAGRDESARRDLVLLSRQFEIAGAVALLLEAVPPETGQAAVDAVEVPVVGCGAGPAPCAHVVVTHDALGLSERAPRFVDVVGDVRTPFVEAARTYVERVASGRYPGPEHAYAFRPSAHQETSRTVSQTEGSTT